MATGVLTSDGIPLKVKLKRAERRTNKRDARWGLHGWEATSVLPQFHFVYADKPIIDKIENDGCHEQHSSQGASFTPVQIAVH